MRLIHLVPFVLLASTLVAEPSTESLNQLQKQGAESAASAEEAGQDLIAADHLKGKFFFSGEEDLNGRLKLPIWFPEFYPTPEEMSPNSGVKPRIKIFQAAAPNNPYYVPKHEILKVKVGSDCVVAKPIQLSPPAPAPLNCLEDVRNYQLDVSQVGSVQESPSAQSYQNAFIGIADLKNLNESKKALYFSGGNPAPSSGEITAKKVMFLKYVPDMPNNPAMLKALQVQVGSTLMEIPVDTHRSFPPAPQCRIQLAKNPVQAEPLMLGQRVKLVVETDSVTRGVQASADVLPNENYKNYSLLNNGPYPVQSIGSFQPSAHIEMEVPENFQGRSVPNNPNLMIWTVLAKVWGVHGDFNHCDLDLQIQKPMPPKCILSANPSQLNQGESTALTLNCNQEGGGPIEKAFINGVDLSAHLNTQKTVVLNNYIKQSAGTEMVSAKAEGPGGAITLAVQLDDKAPACVFMRENEWVKLGTVSGLSYCQMNTHNGGTSLGLANCGSNFNFLSYGNFEWGITPKTYYPGGYNPVRTQQGRYVTGNLEKTNFPWAISASQGADYKLYISNSQLKAEVVKVDTKAANGITNVTKWYDKIGGITIVIKDTNRSTCSVSEVHARQYGGCFTGQTPILMANGKEKLISEIRENDYVLNPHYGMGVRVRKVVKGPEKKPLFAVMLGKKQVEVTEDHPFFTQRGWVQTLDLKPGDQLFGKGQGQVITKVMRLPYRQPVDVWNFELDTEDPLAHVVVANGIPTGDLVTQLALKKNKKPLP